MWAECLRKVARCYYCVTWLTYICESHANRSIVSWDFWIAVAHPVTRFGLFGPPTLPYQAAEYKRNRSFWSVLSYRSTAFTSWIVRPTGTISHNPILLGQLRPGANKLFILSFLSFLLDPFFPTVCYIFWSLASPHCVYLIVSSFGKKKKDFYFKKVRFLAFHEYIYSMDGLFMGQSYATLWKIYKLE